MAKGSGLNLPNKKVKTSIKPKTGTSAKANPASKKSQVFAKYKSVNVAGKTVKPA